MLCFVPIVMGLGRGKTSFSILVCGEASSLSACQNCFISWDIQSLPPSRMHFQKSWNSVKTTVGSTRRAVWQARRLRWGSLRLRAECTPEISVLSTKNHSLKWIHKPFACPVCTADPAQIYADIAAADYTASFTHMHKGRPQEYVDLEYTHNKQNDSKVIYFHYYFTEYITQGYVTNWKFKKPSKVFSALHFSILKELFRWWR